MRAAREHDARQVVVGEDERLLDHAGRHDGARRADLVQRVALPDRDEAVEEAERGGAGEDLDAGDAGLLGERAGALVAALVRAARRRARCPRRRARRPRRLRGARRGREAGDAAADDEHVAVAAAVLRAPLAVVLLLAQDAETGGVAEDLLVDRPQLPRADEGLVVEAGRRERAGEVGRAHHVEAERRPRVLVRDDHARRAPARRRRGRPGARRRRRASSCTGRTRTSRRAGGGT